MVILTIDGQEVQVEEGLTVLEVAKKVGIEIPTLCYHEALTPYGACRLCTVEVITRGRSRLVTACNYPVEEGIEVRTDSEKVIEGRKMVVELLLARCPNVEIVRDLAKRLDVGEPRFELEYDDCTLCGLCVRVCSEVVGVGAIGFTNRGIDREVETPFQEVSDVCIGCGACSYVCPTGAINKMEAEAVKRFLQLPGPERECRYMRMGMVSYKLCPNGYECWRCEVDQRMEDTFGTHPAFVARPVKAKEVIRADEFLLMPDLYYYPGHVWIRRLNGKVRIGLDDFARRLVGYIDDVNVPPLGSGIGRGEVVWELFCGIRSAEMLSPIEGIITDINPDILEDPSLIWKDPYGQGWIFIIQPTNIDDDLKRLLHKGKARGWLKADSERLHRRIGELGVTITDGGDLAQDLQSQLSSEEWSSLVRDFFLTGKWS